MHQKHDEDWLMDSKSKLVGRKLYLKWDKHMYVAIGKIPAGDKKLLEFNYSTAKDS